MKAFSNGIRVLSLFGGVLAATTLVAQADVPILVSGSTVSNWTVPPLRASSAEGGLQTMTDISFGGTFVPMVPCRVFDTRNPNGPYGGPRLVASTARVFDIDSGPCGPIPAGATAFSMNFAAILPDLALGFITIWPTGQSQPLVSTMNPLQGTVVANAAIVPRGTNGAISVFPNGGVHLVGDINGYFTNTFNDGNLLLQVGNNSAGGIGTFINLANTQNSAGVYGIVGPGFTDNQCCAPTGVIGKGVFAGVAGSSQDRGTVGILVNGAGNLVAEGQLGKIGAPATQAFGVNGFTAGTVNADDSAAVKGDAFATTGRVYGGRFYTASTNDGAGGVIGFSADGAFAGIGNGGYAGVIGIASSGQGVKGIVSNGAGEAVVGYHVDAGGSILSAGYLGFADGTGVLFQDGLSGSGTKSFIEPHPTDASKVLKYISLEGNEAGTYFRGRGKFLNGIAVIDVPPDFKMVTDADGLGIQVTPIGQMATVAVQSIGLDRIVVRGSRNVEFFYMVNGVRRAYKDAKVIVENEKFFVPESPDAKLPLYLSDDERQRLITNGTYKADGTVNLETAERLGWTRIWEEKARRPQPVAPPAP